jgi:hypothetical protein
MAVTAVLEGLVVLAKDIPKAKPMDLVVQAERQDQVPLAMADLAARADQAAYSARLAAQGTREVMVLLVTIHQELLAAAQEARLVQLVVILSKVLTQLRLQALVQPLEVLHNEKRFTRKS